MRGQEYNINFFRQDICLESLRVQLLNHDPRLSNISAEPLDNVYKVKCPIASVSVPALTKLHRSIRTTSAMVVLNSTTVVIYVISNCMFSLTTLPVHCCSTVTSWTSSPTLVTLLAKRTCISEYYYWYLSLQCYDTEAL